MNQPRTLADLRVELAQRKAELLESEAKLVFARALAEATAIDDAYAELLANANGKAVDRAKVLGANEAERARNLTLILCDDADYQAAVRAERVSRSAVELLQAQVANLEDERDERKRLTRQDLVDLLAGRNLDDALADVILDLAHPRKLAEHQLAEREPMLPDPDEIREEIERELERASGDDTLILDGVPRFDDVADRTHSDVTAVDLVGGRSSAW